MSVQTPGMALLERLAGRSGVPMGVHLQVADRCNHKCRHCYQVQGEKGELSLGEIQSILDDLAASGVLTLNVSGGEATLREDLPEILRYARTRNFAIRLYSNAYAIDDDLAGVIAAVGVLEVHVSVYSDRDEEHDAVTQVPGSLRKTIAGIRRLRARNVRVVMKTPMTSLAPGGRLRVEALANELGCAHTAGPTITPAEDGSLAPLEVHASAEQLIADGGLEPWLPPADADERRRKKLEGAACGVCTSSVAVMPNGEVRPCTDTLVPLGNLTRQPLREILRSEEIPLFRELRWRDVHGCRDCDLLLACSRCHASAAHESGDYLGPYAAACALARGRYAAGLGSPVSVLDRAPTEASRNPSVGPYEIESPGVLRCIDDRESPADIERVRRFAWIRPGPEYIRDRLSAASTVPLRRSRTGSAVHIATERVPSCTDF